MKRSRTRPWASRPPAIKRPPCPTSKQRLGFFSRRPTWNCIHSCSTHATSNLFTPPSPQQRLSSSQGNHTGILPPNLQRPANQRPVLLRSSLTLHRWICLSIHVVATFQQRMILIVLWRTGRNLGQRHDLNRLLLWRPLMPWSGFIHLLALPGHF